MKQRSIKYAVELVMEQPNTWTEDNINEYMESISFFKRCNIVWCYQNEELFDNGIKVKSDQELMSEIKKKSGIKCKDVEIYTKKPSPNCIQIKYAVEKITHVPYSYSNESIIRHLEGITRCVNGTQFIWCDYEEELF